MIGDLSRIKENRWHPGVLAGLAVVLVTFIPQVGMWVTRGEMWQGAYAITDNDELVYSAYLNSLINNKPRRNDPFLANVNQLEAGYQETYFSIQFIPPYFTALIARSLGFSTSTAFILLTPLMAFASSLSIFWLLLAVSGDKKSSAIGVLLILLCGILASANLITTPNNYAVFSFLRRYIPALSFPLFFIYCLLVWKAFTSGRESLLCAAGAGVIFALLVYSYFFLWTAAGAWFFCITILWLIARSSDRVNTLKCASICGVSMIAALIPYFRLLLHRAPTTDNDQALLLTHAPDLFRFTEGLGALIVLGLLWGVRRKRIDYKKPAALFAASCAVVPFLVFNQQIITGHSLQPFHYEQFIINYLVLVGVVITDQLLLNILLKRPVFSVALALVVGISLALKTSTVYWEENVRIDEALPLFDKLEEDSTRDARHQFALFDRTILSASTPTYCSSLPVLWSHYTYTYGSISPAENKERLFQYFYFMGVDESKFENLINGPLYRAALFGLHRVNSALTQTFEPVSSEEIRAQVRLYATYKQEFSEERAELWPLSYVILTNGQSYDLSNLDRWYERDEGEVIGNSKLYRVHLRSDPK